MPAHFLADLPGVQLAALPPARLALLSLGSIEYLARYGMHISYPALQDPPVAVGAGTARDGG